MKSFFGFACTESDLHFLAESQNSPYAGYENAPTEITWELQERFKQLGPFRLMTAKINGELGYLFIIGMDDCTEDELPLDMLEKMEDVFGGGPLYLQQDPGRGSWTFVCGNDVVEIGTVVV